MATRLIGTDTANPRLPVDVIEATQGSTHADLAPGDIIVDANDYSDAAAAGAQANAFGYTDEAFANAKAYTDAQIAAAVIDPAEIAFADTAETIAGDSATTAVSPAGYQAAQPAVDVRAHGATGDGTTDDTAAIVAAMTAATAGTVWFPAGTYRITGPLVPLSGVRIIGMRGATIRQATQMMPVFDLFNVNDVTIEGLTLVNGSGPPATLGSSFRGDAGYLYSAGVWTNGQRHTLADLRIVDFAVGVNLNSSDGTTNVGDHVERIGTTIRNVEISGCNHGVLFLNQNRLVVDGLDVRSHTDSSAGVNPMHGVYGTGAAADTSTDVTIVNCFDAGCTTGTAYQVKYVNGLVIANLTARGCLGLLNAQDVYDVTGSNLSSIGDIAPGTGGNYAFMIGHVTAASARVDVTRVSIVKAIEAQGECSLVCNDSKFSNFTFHVIKNGANTNAQDFRVHGARVTLDGFKARNSGTSNARGFLVGSTIATSDITICNFELDNFRALIDVHSAVAGANVFSYDPFAQRRIPFGAGSYIVPVSGTPPFVVSRRETTITYALVAGNAWPLAGLETVSRFNITAGTAFTIKPPQIGVQAGMVHELAIWNNTAGALGAITWDAAYVFAAGVPTPPAAGATKNIRFMYDGTKWRECA